MYVVYLFAYITYYVFLDNPADVCHSHTSEPFLRVLYFVYYVHDMKPSENVACSHKCDSLSDRSENEKKNTDNIFFGA